MRSPLLCTLLLALAIACAVAGVAADEASRRTTLMNVGGSPPDYLGQAGINVLHSLPRYGGAENKLGVVDPEDANSADAARKYAIGVLLPFVVALVLGMLTWICCFGFCMGRSCCNCCGGRVATRAYTSKDQILLKLGTVILAASVILLFGMGVVSNAAVSSSLDAAYLKTDAIVEYMYRFHTPLKSMADTATNAFAQVQGLNDSVLYFLPNDAEITSYQNCSSFLFDTVKDEGDLLVQIAPVVGSAGGGGGTNFTDLASSLTALQTQLKKLPRLDLDGNKLVAYNVSLVSTLPNPLYSAGVVPSTSFSVAQVQFKGIDTQITAVNNNLNPGITNLQPTISPFKADVQSMEDSSTAAPAATQATLATQITNGDTSASCKANVNALNNALGLLPASGAWTTAFNNFNTQLTSFNAVARPLQTAFRGYAASVVALGQTPLFSSVLAKLGQGGGDTYSVNNPTVLANSLILTGNTLAPIPGMLGEIKAGIASAQASVAALKSFSSPPAVAGAPTLASTIVAVNQSLPALSCIKPVFNRLIQLNNTILTLPGKIGLLLERRTQILVQLQRLLRIQYDLTQAYASLAGLGASLSAFPNMTSLVTGLDALNATLAAFPDAVLGGNELKGFYSDFTTKMQYSFLQGFTPILMGDFNARVSAATNDINNIDGALTQLVATLDSFPAPAALTAFNTASLAQLTAAENMASEMNQVYAQSTQPTFNPIVDPLKTNFLTKLSTYSTAFNAVPAVRPALISSLTNLASDLSATTSAEGSFASTLPPLDTAATNLPDANRVTSTLTNVWVDTQKRPLDALLTSVPHRVLNATVSNIPDLSATASAVTATGTTLTGQTTSLKLVQDDLSTIDGFMSQSDLDSIASGLEGIRTLVNSFPDLVSVMGSLQIAALGLEDAQKSFTRYRHSYYVARQSTVAFKNNIDWLRLLGYMLVLFAPVCVAGCGFASWLAKKHNFSLYMGMCSFSIMAIFFIMTAFQVIPAILIADQCTDFDGFLTQNFDRFGLSRDAAQPWANLTHDTKVSEIFTYFSKCNTNRPPLFDLFAQPDQILAANHINFTDYKAQIDASLAANGNTIGLKPIVYQYFTELDADSKNIVTAALGMNTLFDCAGTSAVWEPFVTSVCSNTGVAGAISLSTCICFLFALCVMPGVCIGIIGYKRFDPNNFGLSLKPAGGGVEDPYSQGLAIKPPSDGHARAPSEYLNSPSQPIAMPGDAPLSMAEIEMIQQGSHGRQRASLAHALAAEPQGPFQEEGREGILSPSLAAHVPGSDPRGSISPVAPGGLFVPDPVVGVRRLSSADSGSPEPVYRSPYDETPIDESAVIYRYQ